MKPINRVNTYTKTCVVCPHCRERTDSSVDHVSDGGSFGPWFCDACGGGYRGTRRGSEIELEKSPERFEATLDLLVLPPQAKPVYIVLNGKQWRGSKIPQFNTDNEPIGHGKQFYYESHSCPTNWLTDVAMVACDGDADPHGLLKFVRAVARTWPDHDPNEDDRRILDAFPEVQFDVPLTVVQGGKP